MRQMNVKLMLVLPGTMLLGGLFAACSDEENVPEPEHKVAVFLKHCFPYGVIRAR